MKTLFKYSFLLLILSILPSQIFAQGGVRNGNGNGNGAGTSTAPDYYVPEGGPTEETGSATNNSSNTVTLPPLTNPYPGWDLINDYNPYEAVSLTDVLVLLKSVKLEDKNVLLGSKGNLGLLEAAMDKASSSRNLLHNTKFCIAIRDKVYLIMSRLNIEVENLNEYEAKKLSDLLNNKFSILVTKTEQASLHTNIGYQRILEDMKENVLKGISLDNLVISKPSIYSIDNVIDLAHASIDAKNIALARDYITKAKAISKKLSYNIQLQQVIAAAENQLAIRPYRDFMNIALNNKQIKDKVFTLSATQLETALVSNDITTVKEAAGYLLYSALSYYTTVQNGKIITAEDSAIVNGTQENEYKDGALALAQDFKWKDVLDGLANGYLQSLKLLLVCNNDNITASDGTSYSVTAFYTQVFAIDGKSIALDKAAFGTLNPNSFQKNKLPVVEGVIITNIDAEKLNKGLETFNEINKIITKK